MTSTSQNYMNNAKLVTRNSHYSLNAHYSAHYTIWGEEWEVGGVP